MSFNNTKINSTSSNKRPDNTGNITLSLNDLGNVSGTPSTDQVLKYTGSGWESSSASPGSDSYILLGQGETSDYSNSGGSELESSSLNTAIHIYDTSPLNTISGATLNGVSGSTNWYESITLPAGNYHVLSQTLLEMSSGSGRVGFCILNTSGNTQLTSLAIIGDGASTAAAGVTTTINSIMVLGSQTTVKLATKTHSSGVLANSSQGNTISEHTYVFIRKVS